MNETVELAPAAADLINQGFELTWILDVERRHDLGPESFADRLDVRSRLVIEPGDRKFRARRAKGFGTTVSDRLVVRDSDDQRLVTGEDGPDRLPRRRLIEHPRPPCWRPCPPGRRRASRSAPAAARLPAKAALGPTPGVRPRAGSAAVHRGRLAATSGWRQPPAPRLSAEGEIVLRAPSSAEPWSAGARAAAYRAAPSEPRSCVHRRRLHRGGCK